MASTYIKRTCDGAYTSTFTWSAWVKRSATGSYHGLFCNKKNDSNSNSRVRFYFSDADRLAMEVKDSTSGDDSFFQTNKLFRDVNAWYHIVLAYDTTQGAENDRIKLWVNNEEITSWEQFNRAGSGFGTLWSSAMEHRIGTQNSNAGTNYYFDGSMSHVHLTYGTAYDATAFGQYDANGVWTIKTSPSVTYGSQGYFVLKDGNSLTDQSGNGNNFTVGGGTLTNTEDNPSNVFATCSKEPIRTVSGTQVKPVLSNGNTIWDGTGISAGSSITLSTLGATTGKYYMEAKVGGSYAGHSRIGVGTFEGYNGTTFFNSTSSNYVAYTYNGEKNIAGSTSSYGASYTAGDIISVALDCDNNTVTFYKNGASQGAISITDNNNFKHFSLGGYDATGSNITNWICNFGNGYFGTTAVASAGTNASGIGIFEYDVPTGYTALSTKGLNL